MGTVILQGWLYKKKKEGKSSLLVSNFAVAGAVALYAAITIGSCAAVGVFGSRESAGLQHPR